MRIQGLGLMSTSLSCCRALSENYQIFQRNALDVFAMLPLCRKLNHLPVDVTQDST